jgi:NADPH:quinone reductase-like Zn-dependent oxidoreductase
MKSFHMSLGAGLSGLELQHHDVPEPGSREVLLRVHATSLNYRELSILVRGRYPLPVKPGVVALCDGAGEVVALGPGVTRVKRGERVMASIFPRWMDGPFSLEVAAQLGGSLDGMLAEYVVLCEDALVPVPAHLSYEEAAAIPCAGVTAWNALAGAQPLMPGDDVLTLGSGSVSLFALLLAKVSGARVIATTSSDEKATRLRALGADHVVNYSKNPRWAEEVRDLSGGRGVQRVVEVGGSGTLEQSLRAVAMGGEVGIVGSLAGGSSTIDASAVLGSGACLRAIAAGSRAHLARVARAMTLHESRPVIARVFELDDAPAAFAWYFEGRGFGKTVIRVAS